MRQQYGSIFWGKGPRSRPHSRLTHTLGLIGQRPHLVLKEFGLQLEGVLHVLGLGQLVAEVECRADIALHKITKPAWPEWRSAAPRNSDLFPMGQNTAHWPVEGGRVPRSASREHSPVKNSNLPLSYSFRTEV